MPRAGLTIRDVAAETGISTHTLRYYERIGLLAPVSRTRSGHRRYGSDDVRFVELLAKLHTSGMSIRKMQEFARLVRKDDLAGRRALLDQHRQDLEAKVRGLQATLRTVRAKISRYDRLT